VNVYRLPEEPWKHVRTTNPVCSPFALVRLRTTAGKRDKNIQTATALIWEVFEIAESRFPWLDLQALLPEVAEEGKYEDRVRVKTSNRAAAV